MPMRIAERDHTHVIPIVQRGNACQGPAAVPVHGNVIGEDQVDDAALEADEYRSVARRAPDLAGRLAALKLDAAAAEVAHRLPPDVRIEAVNLLRCGPGPRIHHTMNGH